MKEKDFITKKNMINTIKMSINIKKFQRKVNTKLFYLNISVKLIQEYQKCNMIIFKKNQETEKSAHYHLFKNHKKSCFKNVTKKQVAICN